MNNAHQFDRSSSSALSLRHAELVLTHSPTFIFLNQKELPQRTYHVSLTTHQKNVKREKPVPRTTTAQNLHFFVSTVSALAFFAAASASARAFSTSAMSAATASSASDVMPVLRTTQISKLRPDSTTSNNASTANRVGSLWPFSS
jgi:hypothetical protein